MTRAPHRPLGRTLLLHLCVVVSAIPAAAQPLTQVARAGWRVGGPVVAVARLGPVLYLGGNFRGIAPERHGAGNMLLVGADTGQRAPFPGFDGNVSAIEADGAGGWFVGGNFVSAQDGGTQSRFRLAHVLANGHLDPAWTPRAEGGLVRVLTLVPGVGLFVAGEFTTLNGAVRPRVGLLDPISGAVQPWTYDVAGGAGTVRTLAYDGGTLFIGGGFATVDGLSRPNLVAVSATSTGQVGSDLGAAAQVETVSVAGPGLLYVGGAFTTLKGEARHRLARFTHAAAALDVTLDPWNPVANGTVRAVAPVGTESLFVGGDFTTIAGVPRSGLARLDAASGTPTAFAPSGSLTTSALVMRGDVLYAAGPFDTVSGLPRNSVAAFSISTGGLLPWNPAPAGTASVLGVSGAQVAIGGSLTGYGASTATYLAAVNLQTGQLLPFLPRVNGIVRSMTVVGNAVYIGGEFSSAGGAVRNGLAALDAVTGSALPWNPNVNGSVAQMRADASSVYVVGSFSTVGGQPRNMVARLRLSDGSLDTTFTPDVVQAGVTPLQTLVLDGSRLYVGGGLVTFGGTLSTRLALLDATTGAVQGGFTASVSGPVQRLDLHAGALYIAGAFTQVNGQPRTSFAKVDATTGGLQPWAPQIVLDPNLISAGFSANGADVDAQDSVALISGAFSTVNGAPRNGIAQVDTTTGATTAWTPTLGGSPGGFGTVILAAPDVTIVGGGRIRTADEFLNGIVIFVEPSAGQPLPPSGLTAEVTGATLRIHWTEPPLARAATAYVLEAGNARGLTNIAQVNVGGTELVVNGVPPGTYFVRVRAVTALGTSVPTPDLAITVGGHGCASPPAPPSAPVVTVTGSTLTLDWVPQIGAPPTSYELHAGTTPGASNLAAVDIGGGTTLTVPGVPPGVYYVRLHGKNGCGISQPSPEVTVAIGGALAPPGAPLALTGVAAGGTVSLQWTAPPLAAVTGYRLEAGSAPGLSNLADVAVTGTSFAAGGVPPGVYFIRVRAFNAAGIGVGSNELLLLMP